MGRDWISWRLALLPPMVALTILAYGYDKRWAELLLLIVLTVSFAEDVARANYRRFRDRITRQRQSSRSNLDSS